MCTSQRLPIKIMRKIAESIMEIPSKPEPKPEAIPELPIPSPSSPTPTTPIQLDEPFPFEDKTILMDEDEIESDSEEYVVPHGHELRVLKTISDRVYNFRPRTV